MRSNLVALNISDENLYQKYREEMTPLLESYGGCFKYDFKIAEVLKSQVDHSINRVFVISFPDEESQVEFFSNEQYLKIKEMYFSTSVNDTHIITSYED